MKHKQGLWLGGFILLLIIAIVLSLLTGQIEMNLGKLWAGELSPEQKSVLLYIRLPRTIVGVLAGSALGISGAVLQGMFANPLADPGIIGISGGAALGAVLSIVTGLSSQWVLGMSLFAFLGALGAVILTVLLAYSGGKLASFSLLLSGVAVSIFFGALTSGLLTFASDKTMHQYLFWMVGGLDYRSWEHIYLAGPFILAGIAVLCLLGRQLDILSLGELEAQSVGMDVLHYRMLFLFLATFVTSGAVSISGNIAFVGLIVPHIIRLLLGPNNKILLPFSALAGGIFLVACDTLGRVVFAPLEIRVGIMTALLGAPYFLFLLSKGHRQKFWE